MRPVRVVESGAPEAGSSASRFVGREGERAELRAALDDADNGRGRLFLISGEPGIGKTRLAEELAAESASRGMRVAWGRCWEGAGAPAYWPWVEIVRSLVLEPGRAKPPQTAIPPEIGQLIPELSPETIQQQISSDPEQARFRLFDAVATLLKQVARTGPLVIILDDLHEADRSSLELLKFVARGLTDSRIVIVGTHRDAEVRRSPYLAESIGEILRHGNPMPLAGLDENEVTQMIEYRAERLPSATFASELHRVTAGNPLFVDGVIRVLVAERKLGTAEHLDLSGFKLPEGVRGAIRKRLAMLSAEAQSALAVAAVIGQEFDAVLLECVRGKSGGTLAELMREAADIGIVAATSRETYRFTHPLIREALYKDSTDAERVRLHRAIGEALEQLHAANLTPHLAPLAHHFCEAQIADKAIDYSIRAGEAAFSVFAYQEAGQDWETALMLLVETAAGAEPMARLMEQLSNVNYSVDEAKGFAYMEQALRLYERLNRSDKVVWLNATLAIKLATPTALLNVTRAQEYLSAAQDALSPDIGEAERAVLNYAISLTTNRTLQTAEGLLASGRAMEAANRLGDRKTWAKVAQSRALHYLYAGRLADGFALVDRAWQAGDLLNDLGSTYGATSVGAGMRTFLYDPRDALAWCQRELAKQRTARSTYQRATFSGYAVENYVMLGELSEAGRMLSQTGDFRKRSWINVAEGDWEAAEQNFTGLANWFLSAGCRPEAFTFFRVFAWVRRLLQSYSAAEALMRERLAICRGDSLRTIEMTIRPEMVLLYADMNRHTEAKPHLERCREIIAAGENWRGLTAHVARAEATIAAACGNQDEAERQFARAIDVYGQYALPWEGAETLLYWGRALNATDDPHANEKFDAAIELYRRHGGGQRWIDRVEGARQTRSLRSVAPNENGTPRAIFRREGEFWTIVWHGKTIRLKDAKGLRYIAYLLAHPGAQIHVHDLITVVDGSAADTQSRDAAHSDGLEIVRDIGSRDSALDSRARSEYGARLRELRTELDEAERFNDSGRAERLRAEIDLVSDELTAGLGRRASSDNAERARGMVSKRIRAALDKIHDEDPALGRHFTTSIKTGYFCAYLPDPDHKITWQL